MRQCPYCKKEFEPSRIDQQYCCANHRTYASRRRARAEKKKLQLEQKLQFKAMLELMFSIAPRTARGMEKFYKTHGLDCAFAAVKMCLTAFDEAGTKIA